MSTFIGKRELLFRKLQKFDRNYELKQGICLIFLMLQCFEFKSSLSSFFFTESYIEVELVNRLQSVVEKQRGQIKKLEQSNIEYKSDNEEVS